MAFNSSREAALATYCLTKAEDSLADFDTRYRDLYDRYYRLWRGIWYAGDKKRNSERSHIIVPALSEAIEATTAELESAFLTKGDAFFDMIDTGNPDDKEAIEQIKDQLRTDMGKAKFGTAIATIMLMGTIFGTGIGRLMTSEKIERVFTADSAGGASAIQVAKKIVKLVPVLPHNFALDGTSIEDSSFVAEFVDAQPHAVKAAMDAGIYEKVSITLQPKRQNPVIVGEDAEGEFLEVVRLLEFQGLVPERLLDDIEQTEVEELGIEDLVVTDEGEETPPSETAETYLDEPWVEAIVTVMNGTKILRAERNETLSNERLYVAYRHEPVPGQFHGRGVAEKGFHPQSALDASMRARLDGMALTTHPMMGVNNQMIPKQFKFTVAPGRQIRTNGLPTDALQPIHFGQMDPQQYTDINELKNQVSMATGALDTGIQLEMNSQNGTLGGLSMVMSGFIKRSLRTIGRIEEELMEPLVRKTFELYMQIDPDRYPPRNYTFKAVSAAGTMAREIEQAQLLNLLKTTSTESPAYWITMKAIWMNSSINKKEDVVAVIDQQLLKALDPTPSPAEQLQQKSLELDIQVKQGQLRVNYIRAQAEVARAANELRLAPSKEARDESQAILNLAKAEAAEVGHQIDTYRAQVEALMAVTTNEAATAGATANDSTRLANSSLATDPQAGGQPGLPATPPGPGGFQGAA